MPSSGPAATVQGEVIRISGRIGHELEGNGGCKWDADFKKMAEAFLDYVRLGNPLLPPDLGEAATIVAEVKRKSGDTCHMAQIAVKWVLQNPQPLKLEAPEYGR